MTELAQTLPGVWSWQAPHPDWEEGDGWEPIVRCWAIATPAGLVLVDPLIRDDLAGGAATWLALEDLAAAHGSVVGVVRTLHFHHRSASQAAAHFDVPVYARPRPREDLPLHPVDRPSHDGEELLGGLVAHHVARDDELVLEIPEAGALLFADIGTREAGRFELCPEWWVHAPDRWADLRAQLRTLGERVAPRHLLVSHGEPADGDGAELTAALARGAARPLPPFIDAEDLDARRPEGVRLIDARLYLDGRSARAGFEAGHVPGAAFLDFEATLSDPPGPEATRGRHPLPSPERFAAGLAAAGISDGDTVVAYDDAGGVMAARLVWLLRAVGADAALLAPVPESWESGPVPTPAPGSFSPRAWPAERFAAIEEVAARGPETVLLDARDPERYAGGPDPFEPRSGHIPGAVNLPARANVDAHGGPILDDALWSRLEAAGLTPETDVISSCGSGVTACHNLLLLEQLHLRPGRLYPGSFSEWSRDPSRAVSVGH